MGELGTRLFGWLEPRQRRELHHALQRIIRAADTGRETLVTGLHTA
jgi:hypothetical protein